MGVCTCVHARVCEKCSSLVVTALASDARGPRFDLRSW